LTYSNMGDHMIGNTFVRFTDEDQAAACLKGTHGRYYAGRKVHCKYSPVTDFDNARCRDFQSNDCKRGQFCNFAHFMTVPRFVTEKLTKFDPVTSNQRRKKNRLKRKRDNWPDFPVGGTRMDRVDTIRKWNDLREQEGKKLKTYVVPEERTSSLNLYKPGA